MLLGHTDQVDGHSPHPGCFWVKSAQLLENKRVEFFAVPKSAQECERKEDRSETHVETSRPGRDLQSSPRVFVSVASKGLSLAVSLLFATFAWRSISVAVKRLKAMVGTNLDRVGECHWTVVSGEETGRRESARDKRARMCGGTSRLSVNKHGRE